MDQIINCGERWWISAYVYDFIYFFPSCLSCFAIDLLRKRFVSFQINFEAGFSLCKLIFTNGNRLHVRPDQWQIISLFSIYISFIVLSLLFIIKHIQPQCLACKAQITTIILSDSVTDNLWKRKNIRIILRN